jgi:hypothetical protein
VKQFRQSITQALIAGILFVLPVYLAILLLLKAAKSLGGVVKPLTRLLPHWAKPRGPESRTSHAGWEAGYFGVKGHNAEDMGSGYGHCRRRFQRGCRTPHLRPLARSG